MTRIRRCLLHCINLNGPHTGRVIFYCFCQRLINPCTSSILLSKRERGRMERQKHLAILHYPLCFLPPLSVGALYLFSLSLFIISLRVCHQLTCLLTHPLHFFFFTVLLHTEALIFSRRGAHFSQTVMNGSGFCIDFQTETI